MTPKKVRDGLLLVFVCFGIYCRMAQYFQREIKLSAKSRGCHLVTREICSKVPEIQSIQVGMANFFRKLLFPFGFQQMCSSRRKCCIVLHTSASLTINENFDPDVREDTEQVLDRLVPESDNYLHDAEGPDDMPAHVKSSLFGVSLNIPIRNGILYMGQWQGIWLCEHRQAPQQRRIAVTLHGLSKT